jgi:putative FmdB family regulatory protein
VPIYEYRCAKCDRVTEALQRVSDPPLKRCEHCGGKLAKIISRTSFQLKGGGWYAQGYGGSPPAKSDDAGGSEKKKGPAGESKGESKDKGRAGKKSGDGEPKSAVG